MTEDARLKQDLGDAGQRDSRRAQDRDVTQRRDVSDSDRLEMFRLERFNNVLPNLPEIPGHHVCWLTTGNPSDPIHRRIQFGYEPVKESDMPGMQYASLKTGEYAGMIGINEMVAFKLPLSLYEGFMQDRHHDAPAREEAAIVEAAMANGGGFSEDDEGMRDLRQSAPRRGIFA